MNALTQARDMAPAVEREDAGKALARVILEGDLSKLTPAEKVTHYNATCQSLGLNPLTRPLEYIRLNGKEVLYARKDCTDQLRQLRRVSVQVVDRVIADGLVMVTARAMTPDGRQDEEIGAVPLGNLQGEARANAIMKAMTKAKRRVTLSICGLGFLDELEVESIAPMPEMPALAGATVRAMQPPPDVTYAVYAPDGTLHNLGASAMQPAVMRWLSAARKAVKSLENRAAVLAWIEAMEPHLEHVEATEPEAAKSIRDLADQRADALAESETEQQETEA